MLLNFSVDNFKSFNNKTTLSLEPSEEVNEIDYSVLKENISDKDIEALSLTILYGANGSGKSNLFDALFLLREILNKKTVDTKLGKFLSGKPYLKHFIVNSETNKDTIEFEIEFTNRGFLIKYSIEIYFGKFATHDVKPKIIKESFELNNELIFRRNGNEIVELNLDSIKEYLNDLDVIDKYSSIFVAEDQVFMVGQFREIYSQILYFIFIDWFNNKLVLMNSDSKPDISTKRLEGSGYNDFVEFPDVTALLKDIDIDIGDVGIPIKDGLIGELSVQSSNGKNELVLPINVFLSDSTVKFINYYLAIVDALKNGQTVIIDGFDSNIQPAMVWPIIIAFHYDDLNTRNAQLIFTTHNPSYLDKQLVRQDEVSFLDEHNGKLQLYSIDQLNIVDNDNYVQAYISNDLGTLKQPNLIEILDNHELKRSKNRFEYPDAAFLKPGYYINKALQDKGGNREEFAKNIKMSLEDLKALINGEIEMTPEIAHNLSEYLGTSESLWLDLDQEYKDEESIRKIQKLVDAITKSVGF